MIKYETVEYSKDIATSINSFSAYELDVFLCLVYASRTLVDNRKVPDEENLVIELPSIVIKRFLSGTHNSRIKKALENIFDTKIYLKEDKYTKVRHLFEGLDYSDDYKTIYFELKKEYIKLFYNLSGNFTQHKIKEFTSLKSRYAKRIYQLIMSYKGLYKWEFEADEFRKMLDIPKSYGWSDIDVKLIRKIKKELKENTNINDVNLIKNKNGRNISSVVLTWSFDEPEIITEVNDIKEVIEVQPEPIQERKQLSPENENLLGIYKNMDSNIKEVIYEKAKEFFLKNIGEEKLTPATEMIWETTQNVYIVKAIKGEI